MAKWLIAVVGLALCPVGASAQDVAGGQEKVAFEKRSFPFEGEITVERLNVRMFPKSDQTSIITSVLGLGEKVTVVAEKDEYFQILPPKNSTVWVTAKNIKREGEKGVATVNEIPVRLDSRINADVLCTLKEGDAVKVTGEHMGWLKIEAPAAVKYFVGKKYVHLNAEVAVALPAAKKDGGAKKGEIVPAAGASDSEAGQLIANAERELSKQKGLVDQGKIEQVDLSSVVADYEAAKAKSQTEAVRAQADRGLVRYRELNSIIQSAKIAIQLKEKELAERRKALADAKAAETPTTMFQGYIESTGILFKRPGTHKLVMGGRIICFLRVKEGDEPMLTRFNANFQKMIGVNGTVITNPEGWDGYKVVVVEELIQLQKD